MKRWILAAVAMPALFAAEPFLHSELVFPTEAWHNHSSSIVELPGGELLVCWYNGSGERKADDVKVEAARLPRGAKAWSRRVTLADEPGFPDANPVLFLDSRKRLHLYWPTIMANEWHTALLQARSGAAPGRTSDAIRWDSGGPVLFVPRDFADTVRLALEPMLYSSEDERRKEWVRTMLGRADDKYFSRMGWMPRNHPLELPSGRIVLPLYSDGYDFSLMALSDNGGRTWQTSKPLVSAGGVQPSVVRKRGGQLVAYMRDNGPPPKRTLISTSSDQGVTWSPVKDTDIPNPGSSMEVVALRDGLWAMIFNDTEQGRHSLAVALSDDEGASWKWKRHLELAGKGAGSFHYPSLIQASGGALHATYSYFTRDVESHREAKSIKHVAFNVEWVKAPHQ